MDVFSFLKALPAVLGVVGFFAYLWAGQNRIGGELLKGIIEKLRAAPNVDIKDYAGLTPAKIGHLIQSDASVRTAVNVQDQRLIRLIIILQNVVTVIVLLVCAGLIGLGIWLISRPAPLSVTPHPPTSTESRAGELLVDLDPLTVEWESAGEVGSVSVFIENVEGQGRTPKKTVSSDVRSVTFAPDEVKEVATTRAYHGVNRVRTVIEWAGETVKSDVVELHVGLQVSLMLNGSLITPDAPTRSIDTLIATIDDSTAGMPGDYCFSVDFAGWTSSGPLVAPLKACDNDTEVILAFLDQVDWNRHVGLVFNAPEADRLLARTCVTGRPELPRGC